MSSEHRRWWTGIRGSILFDITPPPILYHYTTRAGLLGILKSRRLWASSIRHLNDASELDTAQSAIRAVLEDCRREGADSGLVDRLGDCLERLNKDYTSYVFSLSGSPDLLSQWRAYGRPSDAYAIGFDTAGLSNWIPGADFEPCVYEPGQHRRVARHIVDEALGPYVRTSRQQDLTAKEADLIDQHVATMFIVCYFGAVECIKNQAFVEEREWRIVTHNNTRVRFRDGQRLLLPYVPIGENIDTLPIHHVFVGPTPHPELEKATVKQLLHSYGIRNADVLNSVVPYRNW